MSSRIASVTAKAVFYCSLLTLGVWLFWFGQYQWAGYNCKIFRRAIPGGPPPAWVLSTPCALKWSRPVLKANVGFLVVVPAIAALAAVAVVGFRDKDHRGPQPQRSRRQAAVALMQSWGSTQLPPKRLWLWLCDGLSIKDALVIAAWATFNAVWYAAILSTAIARSAPNPVSPRGLAKGFASLMSPNLVPLLFPVSRGSAINNAIGLSYPEGIRYHRWLGQWVLLLTCLHGLIYTSSWAADGVWVQAALRQGQDTNYLLGLVALLCALLMWATAQEPVRRRFYNVFKPLHHFGFWGFMLMGVAHHWTLFWYFVPGMLLYAVDGVFRLHQMSLGRSGSLTRGKDGSLTAGAAAPPGISGVNAEVLKVDVCPSESMCSLLLAAPEFGAAPAGIVWLNVPAVSATQWHAFDYTASEVTVSADGRVCNGLTADKAAVNGVRRVALSVHIKAYSRWTKALVSRLAQGGQQALTVRVQGPYADPPVAIGQPDGVILVAGGNGIASALPVFEELAASGVSTQGLPALLLWACRKGYEFEFMAAPVLAAAKALGVNLTLQLHITDGADLTYVKSSTASAASVSISNAKVDYSPTNSKPRLTTLTVASASSLTSLESEAAGALSTAAGGADEFGDAEGSGVAGPTSMCPVVAFASFAAQLSFKMVLHLAVFGGFMLGLCMAIYVGHAMPLASGQMPWPTAYLGPTLVLLPAGCAVGLGLITLWIGLAIVRRTRGCNTGLTTDRSPAAAIAAMSGCTSQLMSVAKRGEVGGNGTANAPASFLLQVPSLSGPPEVLPVVANRPAVGSVVQGWLSTLQQLPRASAARDTSCSNKGSGRMYCVVYGCGPTPLDHDTQLAVAAVATKQKSQVMLQFVRKAQML